jgi:hypothetical protein
VFKNVLTRGLDRAQNKTEHVQNLEDFMYMVWSYAVYLAVSLAATVGVARSLRRNGRVFLVDAFHGNGEMADSVNQLLVVGFYLINIGYVTMVLRAEGNLESLREAIELICAKIGPVLLVLGGMHFGNLYIFHRLRARGREPERRFGHGPAPAGWETGGGKVLD